MSEAIETGDMVTIDYEGRFEDGTAFHAFEEGPLRAEIGGGDFVKGLEDELMGMKVGEERKFKISPEDGYGVEKPELIQTLEAKLFEGAEIKPKVGIIMKTPHGNCHVMEVTEETIKINYNHPLAGKVLFYNIKIEKVEKKGE